MKLDKPKKQNKITGRGRYVQTRNGEGGFTVYYDMISIVVHHRFIIINV